MSRARDLADLGGSADAGGLTGRNLIINGAMTIDQRNSGSALTVNTASEFYAVDRFMGIGVASDGVYTLQQVTDAPDNFVNSIKATVTTADASIPTTGRYLIRHKLEGNTISQLNLGSSAAQTFALSFYVKSSLTGTFGGSVLNGAQDRSYPFTYTISSANTWERKTVTIAGDTTGTWPTDNTKAMQIGWSLGVGSDYLNTAGAWVGSQEWGATGETAVIATLNATWQITGIQLEVGETATPFEHRSYGEELALCQRYYEEWGGEDAYQPFGYFEGTGTVGYSVFQFTEKRDAPTVTVSNVAHFQSTRAAVAFTAMVFSQPATTHVLCTISRSSNNWASGEIFSWRANNSTAARIYFNAEL
jgi:uncharacterized protein (DUF2147 family)